MAEYLQGLTGESRKCGVDLVVAHVTGRKVGGQLETERGERVAAELRLLRWPGQRAPVSRAGWAAPAPPSKYQARDQAGRAQDCLCITRKLFMSSHITHNQGARRDAIKVKFSGKRK